MIIQGQILQVKPKFSGHHTYCRGEFIFDARKAITYYNLLKEVIPKIHLPWDIRLDKKGLRVLVLSIQSPISSNVIDLTGLHFLVADLLDIEMLFPELEVNPFMAFCPDCCQWWESISIYREEWYYWKGPRYAGGGRAYYCFKRHQLFTVQDWIS